MEDLQLIKDSLFKQALAGMLAFEIRMLGEVKKEHDSKAARYFFSTPTRTMFAKLMAHARLTDTSYTITEIADLLVISRLAAQRMVDDCDAEGWIETKRSPNKRLCKGSEYLDTFAWQWFETCMEVVDDIGLGASYRAMDAARTMEIDKVKLKG